MHDGFQGRESVGVSLQKAECKYLYTVVISTRQKAFIRQVICGSQQDAINIVLDCYKETEDTIVKGLDRPILINDLTNTWAATFEDSRGFALATVVKTDVDE